MFMLVDQSNLKKLETSKGNLNVVFYFLQNLRRRLLKNQNLLTVKQSNNFVIAGTVAATTAIVTDVPTPNALWL